MTSRSRPHLHSESAAITRAPRREQTEGRRYRAPALEKGLDILELLADRPDGLSQSEIARTLERSVGEIFRMLACLVDRGYVAIRQPGDRYVISLKLFELAHRHEPLQNLIGSALPLMRQLAERVHQSCHLTLVENGHAVVVAQVDAPGEIGCSVRAGAIVDLLSTASGRVLLAFQSDADRRRILSLEAKSTEGGDLAPEDEARLARVRERGHEESESPCIRGVHDVAFPVLDLSDSAVAAITMPFIERLDVSRASLEEAREALGEAAARLSETLGGRRRGAAAEPRGALPSPAQEEKRSRTTR